MWTDILAIVAGAIVGGLITLLAWKVGDSIGARLRR